MHLMPTHFRRFYRGLAIILAMAALLSVSYRAVARVFYAKNGAPAYWNGQPENRVFTSINNYIEDAFRANYFYKGRLVYQVEDGLGAGPYISRTVGHETYLAAGFRPQDGSAQSAIIVTKSGRVLLAAIGRELYQCATIAGSKPLLAVFVRNPKNLRYLPALKTWASSFCGHYVIHLYNLNCKHQGRHPLITNCPLNGKH